MTTTRLLGQQESRGERSTHTAREAAPPRREEGWAPGNGTRVRVKVRSGFTSAQAKWDSNPGKTCHNVTRLRLCHCARPSARSTSWVRCGVLYVFRSSAHILHHLLRLLRKRCNDLHLYDGIHMGTVKREQLRYKITCWPVGEIKVLRSIRDSIHH